MHGSYFAMWVHIMWKFHSTFGCKITVNNHLWSGFSHVDPFDCTVLHLESINYQGSCWFCLLFPCCCIFLFRCSKVLYHFQVHFSMLISTYSRKNVDWTFHDFPKLFQVLLSFSLQRLKSQVSLSAVFSYSFGDRKCSLRLFYWLILFHLLVLFSVKGLLSPYYFFFSLLSSCSINILLCILYQALIYKCETSEFLHDVYLYLDCC